MNWILAHLIIGILCFFMAGWAFGSGGFTSGIFGIFFGILNMRSAFSGSTKQ